MFKKVALNFALGAAGLVVGHFVSMAIHGRKNRKTITQVRLGDMVQWESRGSFVFPQPRRVVNIEEHQLGTYIFVEGSDTGIPVEQVVVIQRVNEDCES